MGSFLTVLRRIGLVLMLTIFSLSLQAVIFYAPISSLLESQETVSTWLVKGRAYENFAPLIANQMARPPEPGEERLHISQPDLERVINESLPQDVLQSYGEGFISGIYGWLRGETSQPVFHLDLNERRPQIEASFHSLVVDRLTGKPVCAPVPSIEDYDPLTANCILPRQTPESTAGIFTGKLFSDEGGLGELVIDSNELYSGEDLSNHPLVKLYSLLRPLRIILTVVVLLSGALSVILAKDWRSGLKRVSWITLATTFFALISTILMTRLLPGAIDRSVIEAGKENINIAGLIIPVLSTALSDIGRSILFLIVPLMVASIAVLIWLWSSDKKAGQLVLSPEASRNTPDQVK